MHRELVIVALGLPSLLQNPMPKGGTFGAALKEYAQVIDRSFAIAEERAAQQRFRHFRRMRFRGLVDRSASSAAQDTVRCSSDTSSEA